MCGIVGVVHRRDGPPVSERTIRRMCDAIRHRGPDDEGRFVRDRVGIGMRRLSIIDLAGGQQPIQNEDGTCVIVFNGEVYNYAALRSGLVQRGHALHTHSDTETVVHLYEELGARCVEQLRGMFAFAIWDARRRSLLLARDRFGIKPLYVRLAPWGLAFASELKALVAEGMTDRKLDWDALDMYFELGYIPAPHTPFSDVRKLEPGHTIEWHDDGRVDTRRYWDLPQEEPESPPNLPELVRAWLDDSVKAHLVSDVPVAAFLSGGLDSSAIVASVALGGDTAHAFTARYHGSGSEAADETPLAEALARRYGAKLTVIDVRPHIQSILEPIVRTLDEPHADESAIPTWLVSEAVSASYKVALSGTGGDELFAGYRRHLGLILGGVYGRVPTPVQKVIAAVASALPEPKSASLGTDRLKRFLRTGGGSPADRFLGYFSRLPDQERRRLYAPDIRATMNSGGARRRFRSLHESGNARAGLSAGLYLDYKTYLPDDILALSDRVSMAHSLEVRVPFVDHELVGHVFPVPDRAKLGWLQPKHLLRRALKPRLPSEHFRAPKRGFVGPTAAWLRRELRETMEDQLASSRLTRIGHFDREFVASLLDDHFSRRQNREGVLWELLVFGIWHDSYVEGVTGPTYKPGSHE